MKEVTCTLRKVMKIQHTESAPYMKIYPPQKKKMRKSLTILKVFYSYLLLKTNLSHSYHKKSATISIIDCMGGLFTILQASENTWHLHSTKGKMGWILGLF